MTIKKTNKEMLVSIIAITPRYGPLEHNNNNNMMMISTMFRGGPLKDNNKTTLHNNNSNQEQALITCTITITKL